MATPVIVAEEDRCTGGFCVTPWTLACLVQKDADAGPRGDDLKGGPLLETLSPSCGHDRRWCSLTHAKRWSDDNAEKWANSDGPA